ncbi:MAG: 23S rRNA (uracil(1939)-C(5))-methyltransferase RlmD [Gammaproteobacteria bacterium]|nr:23S rRNA (uracil(1939)-C(5))-methyltransferase RlmD [Gammaproteobacteria bacterium]
MSKRRRGRGRKQRLPQDPVEAGIEALTPEGRGLAHVDGKAVFIDYALPGERVLFKYTRSSSKFDEGSAVEILASSVDRVAPPCEHFGVCGGCSLQHMNAAAQITAKQDALLNQLRHFGQTEPDTILEPLSGSTIAYRHKARLGVKFVVKKDKVLVGFREKSKPYIAELKSCKVLHESVGERIEQLGELIKGMEARQTIPQIEVAVSEDKTTLVFRHLKPLSASDKAALIAFAKAEDLQIFVQPGGMDTVAPLWPEHPAPLFYELKKYGLRIEFQPADFTQINPEINARMIDQALAFLQLNETDTVLDLFCGLGNFTLPMATQAKQVVGVEGSEVMVVKARENAASNEITNVEFHAADLSADLAGYPWLKQTYDKILLDPPRSGAMEMLKHLGKLNAKRIVYVSCHPATLARDANVLVHEFGYKLIAAGVMDMFPHTAHVESMAVFEK